MVDLAVSCGTVDMNQGKCGAGNVVFARGPEPRDNTFCKCGLAGSKISSQKHQHRRLEPFREFPAPLGCLFGGVRDDFFTHALATPEEAGGAREERRRKLPWRAGPTHQYASWQTRQLCRVSRHRVRAHASSR